MILRKFAQSTLYSLSALALALTLGVSLTGCSSLSDEMAGWSQAAKEVKAAEVVSSDVKTPDIPAHLVKCIQKDPKPGATADQYVANLQLTNDERKACAKAILAWYKDLQKANKRAEANTRPAVKKLTP